MLLSTHFYQIIALKTETLSPWERGREREPCFSNGGEFGDFSLVKRRANGAIISISTVRLRGRYWRGRRKRRRGWMGSNGIWKESERRIRRPEKGEARAAEEMAAALERSRSCHRWSETKTVSGLGSTCTHSIGSGLDFMRSDPVWICIWGLFKGKLFINPGNFFKYPLQFFLTFQFLLQSFFFSVYLFFIRLFYLKI